MDEETASTDVRFERAVLDFLRATDALRPERERFDAPDAVERRIAEAQHDAAKWRIVLQAAANWS